jgi:hypothetical protein
VLKRQARPLGAITGNSLDSIVVPAQVITYNNALPILKFPATMSSKWGATAVRNAAFSLTVTAASINNAPGLHKQIHTSLDSVVGWGKMKVPIAGKTASAWIPVLQVQHFDTELDSFFLNGSPAPTALLSAIGLAQGQSNTVARTYFYRAAAYRPLCEAVHAAPAHSSSVSKLYLHALDLPEEYDYAAPSVSGTWEIWIYPNPAPNGRLHIHMPANAGPGWTYSLTNVAGQQVAKGALLNNEIDLPKGLPKGAYYVLLAHPGHLQTTLPIIIE